VGGEQQRQNAGGRTALAPRRARAGLGSAAPKAVASRGGCDGDVEDGGLA